MFAAIRGAFVHCEHLAGWAFESLSAKLVTGRERLGLTVKEPDSLNPGSRLQTLYGGLDKRAARCARIGEDTTGPNHLRESDVKQNPPEMATRATCFRSMTKESYVTRVRNAPPIRRWRASVLCEEQALAASPA